MIDQMNQRFAKNKLTLSCVFRELLSRAGAFNALETVLKTRKDA